MEFYKGLAMAAYLPSLVFVSVCEESSFCCNILSPLLPSKLFVVSQRSYLLSMESTPKIPTKHVFKK
jgi:hypothetical protein